MVAKSVEPVKCSFADAAVEHRGRSVRKKHWGALADVKAACWARLCAIHKTSAVKLQPACFIHLKCDSPVCFAHREHNPVEVAIFDPWRRPPDTLQHRFAISLELLVMEINAFDGRVHLQRVRQLAVNSTFGKYVAAPRRDLNFRGEAKVGADRRVVRDESPGQASVETLFALNQHNVFNVADQR